MAYSLPCPPRVAVGGVGGSGTRVVVRLLQELGIATGHCTNGPGDNLWFTALFKHVEILTADDREFDERLDLFWRASLGPEYLRRSDHRLARRLAPTRKKHRWLSTMFDERPGLPPGGLWGWKEPNTHLVIDRIAQRVSELRYVHVLRNGLDMAFSSNQNQPELWGEALVGRRLQATPPDSLAYWCATTRRAKAIGERFPERFLLLDYDTLCADPRSGIAQLSVFLGVASPPDVGTLAALVEPPTSVGRFRKFPGTPFDPADVAYVESLGFDTAGLG